MNPRAKAESNARHGLGSLPASDDPAAVTAVRQGGSQTLARGLSALMAVVESADGMTVQDIAKLLDVHRSIAYRVVQTLVEFDLVTQSPDKVYRPGARLAALSESYLPTLRAIAIPAMRELAERVGCTVSLFVAEGDSAVSIAMAEPTTATHHIRFRSGMRTPLDRGAAGYALLAQSPFRDGEPSQVTKARVDGYATSHGEVEEGAHAVAAGFSVPNVRACLNVMTYVEEQAKQAVTEVRDCAALIGERLAAGDLR
ncbi:IclR family transcriptional regulator [Hoyosella subflava]|nr:helix-turn-helix domain-containing protein [Hoyosella subflava]